MIWPFGSSKTPQELVAIIRDGDPKERKGAFQNLLESEDPETNFLLVEVLKGTPLDQKDILIPLIDLVGRKGIEESLEILRPFLAGEDNQVKFAALQAVLRIPNQTSLDMLLPLLVEDEPSIRKQVREGVIRIYGEKAMGALLRALPEDQTSAYYFEVVSLFEEMGFFEKLKEGFEHPDEEVRKFQFNHMIRFHRPDFLPFFFLLSDSGSSSIQGKLRKTLLDYSTEELFGPLNAALRERPSKGLIKLVEDVLLSRSSENRKDILSLIQGIPKEDLRLELASKVFQKVDAHQFLATMDFLSDPSPSIRQLTLDTLVRLARQTFSRIKDLKEGHRDLLMNYLQSWGEETTGKILIESDAKTMVGLLRLLMILADQNPAALMKVFRRLLTEIPGDFFKELSAMQPPLRLQVIREALKMDAGLGTLIVKGFMKLPLQEILLSIFGNYLMFLPEDRELFVKNYVAKRAASIKWQEFLSDPQPEVRLAALQIFSENVSEVSSILEEMVRDPAPEVREQALVQVVARRHPKMQTFLEESCNDPAARVVLRALQSLKDQGLLQRYPKVLSKAVGHPNEEVRFFALREVAKITQQKYIENFNKLSPEIRKLAGSAISKLDVGFVEHLLNDLRSLDTDARLRAALILENIQAGDKARSALLTAMQDPSRKVRAAVVKTLGVLGDESLLGQLIEFLNDPDERVRANTIEAISGVGDQRAMNILLPFLEDSNNRIRANAAFAVWQIGKINIQPVLAKMLVNQDPGMRASALWVMGETRFEANLQTILAYVRDPNDMVRLNAVKSAMRIRPDSLKPFLSALRKDPNLEIKKLVTKLSFKIL